MQTSSIFSIIFFTRKSRNAANKVSIYVRITMNGKRSEISHKKSVLLKEWDSTKTRVRGNTQRTRIPNNYLDQVSSKLLDSHKLLLEESKIVSAHNIKARHLGEDETHKTLRELITYHNKYRHVHGIEVRNNEKLCGHRKVPA